MAFDDALGHRIRASLGRRRSISEKKMFGGLGFLLNGNILVGVWKDSMIVRLGREESDAALREPHVRVFDITGKAMVGWVMVGPAGVESAEQVQDWVERALPFVAALPAR